MMKKRVFIAIDLPKALKDIFVDFFAKVKKIDVVKWEKAEKLHLTLAFLGFIDEIKIPSLISLLTEISQDQSGPIISIRPQIEGFPTASNPRVLWLALAGDVAALEKIAERVSEKLKDKKFTFDDRGFLAHLTIGRFKSGVKKWQKEKIAKAISDVLPQRLPEFTVTGVSLYESRLTAKGSVYNRLHHEDFRD